jgi:hypothetical protein
LVQFVLAVLVYWLSYFWDNSLNFVWIIKVWIHVHIICHFSSLPADLQLPLMRHSAAKSYPKPSIRITGKSKPTQPLPMTAESADSQQSLLFSPLLF